MPILKLLFLHIEHEDLNPRIKVYLVICSAVLLFSCTRQAELCSDGKAFFSISVGGKSDSLTRVSGLFLKQYLDRITGSSFRLSDTGEVPGKQILIGREQVKDTALLREISSLKDDGFIIQTEEDRIIIAGATSRGDMNGASTFLEESTGYTKLTSDAEYVPSIRELKVRPSRKKYEPAFSFRHPYFADRHDPFFTSLNKISSFDDWGLFVHTFRTLCSPEEYFDAHPGYFSLVNGKRIRDGQLCLSNPAVIKLLGDNLEKLISKNPTKKYWSVSQNDCINYCECENCKKLYEKYGNVSGAYIEMANTLAERFPDKQISTLAYQFTRQAPINIRPRDNVNIMFCSIECNRSMPLADDPRSSGFVKDMKDWEKLTGNIFVWDYVVQFKTYLCPFPNIHVLQPNIKFFRDHHASMMFQQGSGDGWSDLCELKQYLISKLLWDPDINADSVVTRFCNLYYGPASPSILEYHHLAEKTVADSSAKWGLDIYGLPSFYFRTHLTGSLMRKYEAMMDAAEKRVSSDSIYLKRVLGARCAVDFAFLDYALNSGDSSISFIRKVNGSKEADLNMNALLTRFRNNCILTGITHVGEEKLTVGEYLDHVERVVNLSLSDNKAEGKNVRSFTPFHPRY
ncbi:MAG: DUF4838 domain-containing protein [Bacteroidales bacterium]